MVANQAQLKKDELVEKAKWLISVLYYEDKDKIRDIIRITDGYGSFQSN